MLFRSLPLALWCPVQSQKCRGQRGLPLGESSHSNSRFRPLVCLFSPSPSGKGRTWGKHFGCICGSTPTTRSTHKIKAVPEYCWLFRLVSGTAPNQGPSVFPIALPTVLGDALRLSPSTVGSPDWFQEWLRIKAHRFSQSLSQPCSETP